MIRLIGFILIFSYPLSALAAPIKCAADDSACLIQSLTEEVIQREYLEKKLAASDKAKTLAEQYAEEQKKLYEKEKASNDAKKPGSTWFLCGLVGGIATAFVFGIVRTDIVKK